MTIATVLILPLLAQAATLTAKSCSVDEAFPSARRDRLGTLYVDGQIVLPFSFENARIYTESVVDFIALFNA